MKLQVKNFSTIAASEICRLEQIIKEKDLIIYGIEEGAEEWKAKCNDLEYQLRQQSDKKWSDEDMLSIANRLCEIASEYYEEWSDEHKIEFNRIDQLLRKGAAPSEPKQVYGVEDMVNFAVWATNNYEVLTSGDNKHLIEKWEQYAK